MKQTQAKLVRGRHAFGIAVALCCGCSGGNDLPMVPVRGRVTFNGGPCPAEGQVTFMPIEIAEGLPRRPAVGKFSADGVFSVTSFQPGDGLIPGRYNVEITCYSGPPDFSKKDPFADINYVPKDFELDELTIAADSSPIQLTFDVPPKQ